MATSISPVWGPAQQVSVSSPLGPYPQVSAISCAAPGDCVAAGNSVEGTFSAFVVQETDGVWGNAVDVADTVAEAEVTSKITLKSAKGSCTLAAKKLRNGTYRLVARYGGSSDFTGSASAAASLRVVS